MIIKILKKLKLMRPNRLCERLIFADGIVSSGKGIFSISSETKLLTGGGSATVSEEMVDVWRVFRRPLPGYTFFNEVHELNLGCSIDSQNMHPKQY